MRHNSLGRILLFAALLGLSGCSKPGAAPDVATSSSGTGDNPSANAGREFSSPGKAPPAAKKANRPGRWALCSPQSRLSWMPALKSQLRPTSPSVPRQQSGGSVRRFAGGARGGGREASNSLGSDSERHRDRREIRWQVQGERRNRRDSHFDHREWKRVRSENQFGFPGEQRAG